MTDLTTWIIIGVVVALAVVLCFLLAVATFSFENYQEQLEKTDAIRNSAGFNTLEYVNEINNRHFGGRIKVFRCAEWQDCYSGGKIALSDKTMSSSSLASLSIVSHELGHARQDVSGNTLTRQYRLRFIAKVCSFLFMPLVIAAAVIGLLYVFEVLPELFYLFIAGGLFVLAIFTFLFAVFVRYREVKIEKEASDYACDFLKEFLREDEVQICNKFLRAARLTYWSTLIRSLLSWTLLTRKA